MALARALTELIEQVEGFESTIEGLKDQYARFAADSARTLHEMAESFKSRLSNMEAQTNSTAATVGRLSSNLDTAEAKINRFKSDSDPHNTQAAIERVNAASVAREKELRTDLTRELEQAVENAYRSMDIRQELSGTAQLNLQSALARVVKDISDLGEKYDELLEQGHGFRRLLEGRVTH